MLNAIRGLLLKTIDDIDAGNTNISEEDCIKIINLLKEHNRKDIPMSKYQVCSYLNVSRATFDNMVRGGEMPEGKRIQGFKEKFWYKKDIDKARNDRQGKTAS